MDDEPEIARSAHIAKITHSLSGGPFGLPGERWIPASVALDVVLMTTPQTAIWLSAFQVTPAGFRYVVEARSRVIDGIEASDPPVSSSVDPQLPAKSLVGDLPSVVDADVWMPASA